MKKRVISLFLAVVMLITMLPTNAIALTADGVYEQGDTIWLADGTEPTAAVQEGFLWAQTGETKSETELVCGLAEHAHIAGCGKNEDGSWACGLEEHAHGETCQTVTVYACGKAEHIHDAALCGTTTVKTCVEHIHSVDTCAYTVSYTCGQEHAHTEECGTEVTYTCGAAAHTHDDVTCTTAEIYACGIEAHTHDETCGASQAYTCTEHTHIEGCAADCAFAHTHSEACYASVTYNEWEVAYALMTLAEEDPTAYTVTVTVPASGYYTLYNSETGWYQSVQATSSGNGNSRTYKVTFSNVPAGSYIIASGKQGDGGGKGNAYVGTVTVGGSASTVTATLSSDTITSFTSMSTAQQTAVAMSVYAGTSSFGHVDIRVSGTFNNKSITIIASKDHPVTVNINGKDYEFTKSTSYEWRTEKVSVSKGTSIKIAFWVDTNGDGTPDKEFTKTFSTAAEYIEAIRVCDGVEGLDFYLSAEEIEEAVTYDVSYTWTGLSDGLAPLPEGTTNLTAGTSYTVNTSYTYGTKVYDTSKGIVYTFQGWYKYTYNDSNYGDGENSLTPTAPGSITMPASDVVIHGLWTSEPMPKAEGTITLTKKFLNLTSSDEYPSGFYIQVSDGTNTVDVDFSQFTDTDGDGVWTYSFPITEDGTYVISEQNYTKNGYTHTATADASGVDTKYVTVSSTTNTSVTLTIALPHTQENTSVLDLGKVGFTNSYTKKTGTGTVPTTLHVRKHDSADNTLLEGVTFVLYQDEACTTVVDTKLTGPSGYAIFEGLEAGTYYLKETATLSNYVKSDTVYKVVVEAVKDLGYEAYDKETDTYITYTVMDVTAVYVKDDNGAWVTYTYFNAAPDANNLTVYNDRILGKLTVTKGFEIKDSNGNAVSDAAKTALLSNKDFYIRMHIHGPVTMSTTDGVTTVTDWGTEYAFDLTSANWTKVQQDLELGTYLVHEVYVHMNGYNWTGALSTATEVVNVTLEDDTTDEYSVLKITPEGSSAAVTITNQYQQWTLPNIIIHKLDENGSHLAGATFTLYKDAACTEVLKYQTTGTDGYAKFLNLEIPEGQSETTYYLKETAAPNGYLPDSTVYEVHVYMDASTKTNQVDIYKLNADGTRAEKADVNDTLTVTNEPMLGSLTVEKKFTGDLTEKPVIYITVTGDNGYTKTVELNGKADEEGETSAWTASFENLKVGTYTVTEADASIPGYELATTWQVNGAEVATPVSVEINTDGQSETVTVTNDYDKQETDVHNPASFQIIKVDSENHTMLAGAEFALYVKDSSGNYIALANKENPTLVNEVPISFTTSAVTDASGKATFSGLWIDTTDASETRTYYLKETKAPEGYILNENAVWEVVIKEKDGKVTVQLNEEKNIFESIYDWVIGQFTGTVNGSSYSAGVLTVHNDRIKGSITLTKSFQYETGDAAPNDMSDVQIMAHVHGPYAKDAWNATGFSISEATDDVRLTLTQEGKWTATKTDLELGYYLVHEAYTHIPGYNFKGADFGDDSTTVTIGGETYCVVEISSTDEIKMTVTNTYDKWDSVDLEIHKVNESGAGLAGATFTLYADAACANALTLENAVTSGTTNGTGILELGPFHAEATYYLKETAPTGYNANNNVYTVTIAQGTGDNAAYTVSVTNLNTGDTFANDELTVVNTPILGSLTISKTIKVDEDDQFVPPAITFTVSGDNGYTNTVVLDGKTDSVETTAWSATLSGLRYGTYTVTEGTSTAIVPGYTLTGTTVNGTNAASVNVDLETNGAELSVAAVNTYKKNTENNIVHNKASFTVKKVNPDGEPLSGAVFTLYTDKDCKKVLTGVDFTTRVTTGDNGIATFSGLWIDTEKASETVTYYLKEDTAPNGYVADTTVWEVTIREKDGEVTVKLNEDSNVFESIYDWIVGLVNPGSRASTISGTTLTVTNSLVPGELTITKTFTGLDDSVTKPTVKFTVTGPNSYSKTVELANNNGTWSASLDNLAWGTYTITEDKSSAAVNGYDLNAQVVPATVTISRDNLTATVSATNTYTEWNPASVTITKVDAEDSATKLAGVTFGLYSDETCTKEIIRATTDANGIATFTFTAEGKYYVKEISTLGNYVLSDKVWPVTVSYAAGDNGTNYVAKFENGTSALTVENEKIKGAISFTKEFSFDTEQTDENLLKEAAVEIHVHGPIIWKDKDKGIIESLGEAHILTLNVAGDWKGTVSGLELGEYAIRETYANLHGYTWQGGTYNNFEPTATYTSNGVDYKFYTVEITEDGNTDKGKTVPVGITNTYKTWEAADFAVYKVDENNQGMEGVEFTMYTDAACTKIYDDTTTEGVTEGVQTTGISGRAYFENLTVDAGRSATYYVKETKAPEGYYLNDDVWKVTISHGTGTSKYSMTIVRVSGDDTTSRLNTSGDEIKFVDEPILGTLTITKKFSIDAVPEGTTVKLTVTGPNDYSTEVTLDGTETSPWTATLTDLYPGTYTVTEDSATVYGYDWVDANFSASGDVSVAEGTNAANVKSYTFQVVSDVAANSVKGAEDTGTVEAALTVTNNLKLWDPATIKITKVDAENTAKILPGVTFGLYNDKDEKIDKAVTDEYGIATFTFTAEGEYYVKEISTLNNYVLSDTVWPVTVSYAAGDNGTNYVATFSNGTSQLTVENAQKVGKLTITKDFGNYGTEGENGFIQNELPEADRAPITITVTGPNSYTNTVVLDGTPDETETSAWTATLTGLKLGEYTIEETAGAAAIAAYKLEKTTYTVGEKVTEDNAVVTVAYTNETNPAQVKVTNTYSKVERTVNEPVEFQIVKLSADGKNVLEGAQFTLYNDAKFESAYDAQTTDSNGKANFSIEMSIDGVTDGYEKTFYLKETKAPTGYVLTETVWEIKVSLQDGKVIVSQLNKENTFFETIYDWIISQFKPSENYTSTEANGNVLTVYNTSTKLTIEKAEKWILDGKVVGYDAIAAYLDELDVEREYTFEVTWKLGESTGSETVTIDLGDDDTTNDTAVVEEIPVGAAYTVTEITGSNDVFVVEKNGITGTMNETGEAEAEITNIYTFNKWDDHEDDPDEPDDDDHEDDDPEKDSGILRLCLDLTKIEINQEGKFMQNLSGVQFKLTNADGSYRQTAKSDKNGNLTFDIPEAGTYTISEVKAPEGYVKMDDIVFQVVQKVFVDSEDVITIKLDTDVDTVLVNEAEYVSVSVTKKWDYDADDVTAPSSVKMTLYRNGVKYETVKLNKDNKWTYTWEDLPAYDTWTVDEEKVPSGFYRTRSAEKVSGKYADKDGDGVIEWVITNHATANPKTGDMIRYAVIVMAVSAAALVVLILLKKKSDKKKDE